MLPQQQQGAAAELAFAGAGGKGYQPIHRRGSFGLAKPRVSPEEEAATDTESGGSSEEMVSLRSLAGSWRRRAEKKFACLHSQVLRIREEDLHLGEDIGEGLSAKDKVSSGVTVATASRADVVLFSRPILPCSPLSGKVSPIQSLG